MWYQGSKDKTERKTITPAPKIKMKTETVTS